jgi:Protein of unknown function (DUF2934)
VDKIGSSVQCGDCETFLVDESPNDKERRPCPECGSLRRDFKMHVADELKLYEQFRIRQKQHGTRGYVHDQIVGDDFTKATGKFNKKVRIIDRKSDHYYECITNAETGNVIHLRDEILSQHFGRGSAKLQPHNLPHEHVAVAAYFIWEKKVRPDDRAAKHWEMAIDSRSITLPSIKYKGAGTRMVVRDKQSCRQPT